jgi:aminoglycoside phosphotransferase family enzyme
MGELKQDLKRVGVELKETHISWVFLTDQDVWKVKKPVSLGFLDFSTSERRRAACEAEIRLNRRLAPDVYLGVVPITLDDTGRHRIGGEGPPVDWAVHMVRLPDTDRADVRLAQGGFGEADIERIAVHVAAFHGQARSDEETARYGTLAAIGLNVRENFEQTRETISAHLAQGEAEEIETWQGRFLEEHAELFEERIRAGRIKDGHGDLRIEHIYLDREQRVTILDCIEFNERFRFIDVCADVSFLSMGLAWHERVEIVVVGLARVERQEVLGEVDPLMPCQAHGQEGHVGTDVYEAKALVELDAVQDRHSLFPVEIDVLDTHIPVPVPYSCGSDSLLEQVGVLLEKARLPRFDLLRLFLAQMGGDALSSLFEVLAHVATDGGHGSVARRFLVGSGLSMKSRHVDCDAFDIDLAEATRRQPHVRPVGIGEPHHVNGPVHGRALATNPVAAVGVESDGDDT